MNIPNYLPLTEIPPEVYAAAELLGYFFVTKIGRDWQFHGVADRRLINKLERERDQFREALETIEGRYTDGSDTYEDWQFMGETARRALEINQ